MLAELPAIDLDEVVATVDLQTRRDRKYLVPVEVMDSLLDGLGARVLDIDGRRSFRYRSVYFDTSCWTSYLGAARRRPQRFKVRTRTYLDSELCKLEVKVRDRRGNTIKHHLRYDVRARDRLTPGALAFITEFEQVTPFADQLRPVLEVTYGRTTVVLADAEGRATIDRATTWAARTGQTAALDGLALLETKTAGPPSALDRRLWRAGHRPAVISKYCTGLALLRPGLPSNKWHRVLTRDLEPNLVGNPQPVPSTHPGAIGMVSP